MKSRNGALLALLLLASCNDQPEHVALVPAKPAKVALGTIPPSEVAVWRKIAVNKSPAGRYGHAMAYNPSTGKTYVFGGYDVTANRALADLWAWDGTVWTQLTAATSPPAREDAGMAYDPSRKSLILYGGIDYDKGTPERPLPPAFGDTWEWTDTGKWTQLKPATSPHQVGLSQPGMVTDTARSKILLWGGYASAADGTYGAGVDDLWEWDGATTTWTKRTPVVTADDPLFLNPTGITYDEHRRKLIYYLDLSSVGGYTNYPPSSTYWEWDPVSAGWTSRHSSDDFGRPDVVSIAYDSNRRRVVVLIWDGTSAMAMITREIDTDTATWYERTGAGAPSVTSGMVFDSGRNVMVHFGGVAASASASGETWEYQVSKLGDGEGCTAATAASCASGNCVDGVCCDIAACTGKCTSCNVPDSAGTCAAAPAGAEVAGSCSSGLACDATGACKAKNGQACTAAGDCASGFCVDGVCCDSACAGTCVACNLSGQTGTCRPQPNGSDPQSECGKGVGVCKSACDGAGNCGYPEAHMACGTCMTCNGFGVCGLYDQTCPAAGTSDVTCYVDSVNGDDTRSGLSEATAVKSQAKIGSTCNTVRFKRGSVFKEKLRIVDGVTTYGNYGDANDPLPRFVVPRAKSSGPVIQAMGRANLTFDGLSLSGATGDGTMAGIRGVLPANGDGSTAGLLAGSCVVLGYDNQLTGSEISDCDIGVFAADGSPVIKGNYIHDLAAGLDTLASLDPYFVGGGIGVLINGAGPTVSFNTFVHCTGSANPVGGPSACYGGAIEVIVPSGKWLYVTIENNFSYDNCGFTQIGKYSGDVDKGDAILWAKYYRNISIDSGWMAALKVDGIKLDVNFVNNTLVEHKGSTNAGIFAVIDTGTSGADLQPNSVKLANELVLMEDVPDMSTLVHKNFDQQSNLFIDMAKQDPGVVDMKGTTAADFDLTAGSPAINKGNMMAIGNDIWSDFFGRTAGDGSPEIGACDYCAGPPLSPSPFFPGAAQWIGSSVGACGTGGKGGTGGTTSTTTGGGGTGGSSSAVTATGGAGGSTRTVTDTGGSSGTTGIATGGAGGSTRMVTDTGGSGGTTGIATGGAGGSTRTVTGTGGSSGTTGTATGGAGGTTGSGTGGVAGKEGGILGSGGVAPGTGGSTPGAGGSGKADAGAGSGGSSGGRDAAAGATSPHLQRSGCSCALGQGPSTVPGAAFLAVLGLLLLGAAYRVVSGNLPQRFSHEFREILSLERRP